MADDFGRQGSGCVLEYCQGFGHQM